MTQQNLGTLLGTLIADATMIAAAETVRSRGREPLDERVIEPLLSACRREANAALARIVEQGADVLEHAPMWLGEMVRAECALAGVRAGEEVAAALDEHEADNG